VTYPRCSHSGVLRAALCGSLVLAAVGCYEVHEEVWIREDGTVRYAIDYAVPEFMIITATQVDGGNADSVLAQLRRPPTMVIEGDSVWNREFLDRDLRHFVSERQISSIARWIALAARSEAREDSIADLGVRRDSLAKALTKGKTGKAYVDVMDSLRQANPPSTDDSSRNPFSELTGSVLGGYEAVTDRTGTTRIRHVIFPRHTQARLIENPTKGDDRPTLRMFAGRSYSYRVHAPRILSTNGATNIGDRWVEWSFPMAALIDSVRTLEVVISSSKK
jgi:hypothetical protein